MVQGGNLMKGKHVPDSCTRVLLLDTATDYLVAGVGEFELGEAGSSISALLSSADIEARRSSNTQLTLRLQAALEEAGLTPKDIHGVVCGVGPGSFTGVRIGVATAKGIAHALGVPLFGIPTLDAIAWRLARDESDFDGTLGVVGDAMRGEVYPALFHVSGGQAKRLTPHTVCTPEDLVDQWTPVVREAMAKGFPLTLAGNGLAKYEDRIATPLGYVDHVVVEEPEMWTPTSQGLLDAFVAANVEGSLGDGDPVTVLPVYTRLSDAEENERKRTAQQRTTQENDALGFAVVTTSDLDEIMKIEEASFATTRWNRSMFEDDIARVDRAWLLARNGAGDVLAFAGTQVIDRNAHILDIAVAPPARRAGLGSRILEELLPYAKALGATRWLLEVNENNAEAIAFYEKLGFTRDGVRPGYYADGDAIVMSRLLDTPSVSAQVSVDQEGGERHE